MCQLISAIFEADQIRIMTEFIENADGNDAERELVAAAAAIGISGGPDAGYVVHLEVVDSEVFGRHRSYYVNALGFDPRMLFVLRGSHPIDE